MYGSQRLVIAQLGDDLNCHVEFTCVLSDTFKPDKVHDSIHYSNDEIRFLGKSNCMKLFTSTAINKNRRTQKARHNYKISFLVSISSNEIKPTQGSAAFNIRLVFNPITIQLSPRNCNTTFKPVEKQS